MALRKSFAGCGRLVAAAVVLVAQWIGLVVSPAAGAEGTVQALWFGEAPVVDGRVDGDGVWAQGEWNNDFSLITPGGGKPKAQTRFKVGVDSRNLYILAVMERTGNGALVSRIVDHDGEVWRDDALEIMIDPAPSVDQYIHIGINPAGTIYDALRVQGGNLADASLNLSMESAVTVESDTWTVELAIPLAELGLTRETTNRWAINVARVAREGGKAEISSFAKIEGDLHRPQRFAPLVLEKLDAKPFFWRLAVQGEPRVVRENGQLILETNVNVVNETGAYVFFEILAIVHRDEEILGDLSEMSGLDAGASRVFPLRIPVDGDGKAMVDVSLYDVSTQNLLARLQYKVDVSYTPMTLTLTSPAYRNTIYATQSIKEIAGNLEINLSADQLREAKLAVKLEDASGRVLGESELDSPELNTSFTLPVPGTMPVGDYLVKAYLTVPSESAVYETTRTLRRLGPPKGGREVRLDENKITLVDGKPFLPFGAMSIRPMEDFDEVAAQGYTAVHEYSFYWWDEKRQKDWLDRMHKLGLMVVIYPYPEPGFTRDGRPKQPLSPEEALKIRAFVEKWKDHPALLAWYLADEPELHSYLPERIRQIHEICQEVDPYHPTIVLNNTFGGIDTYGADCDILMPNPFPGFYKGRGARRSIEYAYRLVHHAAQANGGSKAIWSTPQAFSWADLRAERQNERPPSFTDLRNMYYQAAIAGSTGFIPYAYQHGRRHPSIRLGLSYLAKEMDLLKGGLLAQEVPSRLDSPEGAILHSLRKGEDGHYYLFVVNVSESKRRITASLPEGVPSRWYAVSEGQTFNVDGSRQIRDELPPLGVRIYTDNAAAAQALNLEKAAEMINKAPVLEKAEDPLPASERRVTSARR